MPKTPKWAMEPTVKVTMNLPQSLHADAKVAAKINRQSLVMFCIDAVEEKVAAMQETDIHAPGFIPPGLRKN